MESTAKPVDRETLYNEVWTEPVSVVAPRYGLSDVGLAKICRSLAIPLPSRGYWAKVKAGKVMHRVPLPPLKHSVAVPRGLVKVPSEKAAVQEATRKTVARVRKEVLPFPPPEEAASPHPLVVAASKRLRRRDGWPEGTLLRSAPKEVLNLSVTKDALDRALALTDALIKALENEGFSFEIDAENGDRPGSSGWRPVRRWRSPLASTSSAVCMWLRPAEERARKRYWDRSRWDRAASYPSIPQHDYTPTRHPDDRGRALAIPKMERHTENAARKSPRGGRRWRHRPGEGHLCQRARGGTPQGGLPPCSSTLRAPHDPPCRRGRALRGA